jgi:hypothetical protein
MSGKREIELAWDAREVAFAKVAEAEAELEYAEKEYSRVWNLTYGGSNVKWVVTKETDDERAARVGEDATTSNEPG